MNSSPQIDNLTTIFDKFSFKRPPIGKFLLEWNTFKTKSHLKNRNFCHSNRLNAAYSKFVMESQLNLSVGAAAASTHRIPIERLPIVFGNDSHPNASTSNRNINAREILVSVETESINSGKLLFNWISGTKHHIKELINLKVNILDLFRSFRIFKTIRTLFE